jgi:hypothetical protein
MNELPYDDEIRNSVLHDSCRNKNEEELDREIFGRFSELIWISNEFVFRYIYQQGKSGTRLTPADTAGVRALCVQFVFAEIKGQELVSILNRLNIEGLTIDKVRQLKSRFRKKIKQHYSNIISCKNKKR